MIISASRRTDIPTYYSEWFANRVREGYVCTRNPMNAHQISRISLDPKVIDCIVFWTKNPEPMLGRLDAFSDYMYYFQFTLTGYGHDVEGNLPDKHKVLLPTFKRLAAELGPERVIWRYDPIAFTEKYTTAYHLRAFEAIATELEGSTEKSVISFVDTYARNRKRLAAMGSSEIPSQELHDFAGKLSEIARKHGMVVATCAEKVDLSDVGIVHNSCIDGALISRLLGAELKVGKDPSQRPVCGCVASIDLGSYNTCTNGCTYCYANFSPESIQKNVARYDPTSPILCDEIRPDDVIKERAMKSLIEPQGRLNF